MATTVPPAYEYGMLAAKLEHEDSIVNTTVLPVASSASQVPDFKSSQHDTALTPIPTSPDVILTPSVSKISISDQKPGPSTLYPLGPPKSKHDTAVNVPVHSIDEPEIKVVPEQEVDKETLPSGQPLRTLINRSKIQKRIPKSSLGSNNAALKKTLIAAVAAHKHNIVEQLLDRGVSPDTGPENNAVLDSTYKRDVESLKLLLEFGADPNAKATDGNTPLRCACEYNHEEEAKVLLEYGADPNISAPEWTPLPWALNHNSESLVHLLLQYGANPDLVMENGWTSLVYACEKNRLPSIVQEFFTYGASPDATDAHGTTGLGLACYRNHPDLVKVLLSNGANPNLPGKELPMLVSLRYPACLEHLIAAGADLHCSKGIMEGAAHYNCIEAVKLLLDAGLDPNEKSDERFSPLTTAIRDSRVEIIDLLLSRGADPNLTGQDVPLKMAVNKPEILKRLIVGGAKVDLCKGLVEQAVHYNNLESITILLEAGVPIDEKEQGLHTAVTTAIRGNLIECLSFLLSHGADPNEPGDGLPLISASRFADPDRLGLLLDAGADVNRQHDGRTALMEACNYNTMENVKMLLERGARQDAADDNGNTAMDIAAYKGHDEIVKLLLEGMA